MRRPPELKDLRLFNGSIAQASCLRIAVLGTDGAVGKRTTATLLVQALQDHGIPALLVSTGQTGLIQGGRFGIALDAIPSQFCSGEVEAAVVEAYQSERPAVIVIEGQGALSHPAYLSSAFILRGSQPQAVILQHAPARRKLSDFPFLPVPSPASEIRLIEAFSPTRVIGLTLNHEGLDRAALTAAIALYEAELAIPVTDAISRGPERLVAMVLRAFPELAGACSVPV
ncbi:NAD-dependent epimerase/dehydratase family protein [Cyanobium sp. WAJ14-Wanaka]|uniref:NAD-dependent epimerase/dehydratase family protein n=1 Tax=Cyanobium sp. WAJ14-Wanaka TaxID=2823725 RepID=UPI0020CBF7F9|nr:NAD-dependent epimerase/dehydratase family protein [Cyanobium sp. WAJ14-Wanaka]